LSQGFTVSSNNHGLAILNGIDQFGKALFCFGDSDIHISASGNNDAVTVNCTRLADSKVRGKIVVLADILK
jgi:hypothetical protein